MKRKTLFALLLVIALLSVPAFAAADISLPDYVVDDAGVLSPETEDTIRSANAFLEESCRGAQFVVVTVKYTPSGMDREEYATELFDTWHIGDAAENNGFLLLLCTEEDDFWLEAGYGVYNHPHADEIAELVGDNSKFYKDIRKDKDEEAVSILLDGITEWCGKYYGGTSSVLTGYAQSPQNGRSSASDLLIFLLVILILVIITSPRRIRRRYGRVGIWPFFYWTTWYRALSRTARRQARRTPPPPSPHPTGFRAPTQHITTRPSSFRGGSSFRRGSSFGGFRGGGGHSGGGFGHR